MEERKCPFCLIEMTIKGDLYECNECEVTFSEDEIHYIAQLTIRTNNELGDEF